ncbi:hypothetical protein CCP2SC5_320002 [Azospirillaceae bacterium]
MRPETVFLVARNPKSKTDAPLICHKAKLGQTIRSSPYGDKGGFRSPLMIPRDQGHSPWTHLIFIQKMRVNYYPDITLVGMIDEPYRLQLPKNHVRLLVNVPLCPMDLWLLIVPAVRSALSAMTRIRNWPSKSWKCCIMHYKATNPTPETPDGAQGWA